MVLTSKGRYMARNSISNPKYKKHNKKSISPDDLFLAKGK